MTGCGLSFWTLVALAVFVAAAITALIIAVVVIVMWMRKGPPGPGENDPWRRY